MNGIRKKTIAVMAAPALLLVGTVFASPASAAHVTCGATITTSTHLHGNLGPCDQGLNITGSNVVLNLNGFTISGSPAAGVQGIGIGIDHASGVIVRNGRVTGFGAGVYIQGGGNNLVQRMTIEDNIGVPGPNGQVALGDGVVIDGSNGNRIRHNTIRHNGPYDGVGLIGGASNNTINNNLIENNNVRTGMTGTATSAARVHGVVGEQGQNMAGAQQDDGVRIEGPGSKNNAVRNNTIRNNGLDGVAVFRMVNQNTGNIIQDNIITGNGFHDAEHRMGNGVILFGGSNTAVNANDNLVKGNYVANNAANGIRVEAQNNDIIANTAVDNASGALGAAYDLYDLNDNCDANVWWANHYETAFPACTTAGGTQVVSPPAP